MAFIGDIRYALRLLARSPVFTLTAVLSIAIGVASSGAIFSLADALLLRPRAGVADPATLVDIGRSMDGEGFDNFGYPQFEALRSGSTLLEGMSAVRFEPSVMSLGDAERTEKIYAGLVSGEYFAVTGTRAAEGRFFLAEEDRTAGTHPVAVLAHGFWQRRFAGDRSIVGQTLRLNNLPFTVVGIAEEGFTGTSLIGVDLWIPMAMDAHVRAADRSLREAHDAVWMTAIGRLKPGVTLPQVREELNALLASYLQDRGDARRQRWGIAVATSARIPSPMAGPVVGFVAVLGTLTGLVLLIACSNVAAMLLARAIERRREVATRLAIGASRHRIVVQLLLEGLVLAGAAGVVSVPVTLLLVRLLTSFQPSLPFPIAIDLVVDPRVMAFAFVLAALAAVLFALLPAFQATRFDVAPALHGASATTDRRRTWLRHGLVGAQVSLALLLLVTAGLFSRSLQEAAKVDVGFDVDGVDILQLDTRIAGYRTTADGLRVADALVDRFRQVEGVRATGISRMVPLQGGGLGLGRLSAPGYTGPDGSDEIRTDWDVVSPGYFDALGVRLVAGRAFTARDTESAPMVAIVNETLAARVWPGREAVGQRLRQRTGPDQERTLEVVGVARNAKYRSVGEAAAPFIYVPLAQQYLSELTFYVRRQPGPSKLVELRKAVQAVDPTLPVVHADTLAAATTVGLLPQRLAAWTAGSVGTLGLLLAAIGLYGLTAFAVSQRTREIAVRMAIGATRRAVLALVLRQAGRLAFVGAAIGLALATAASVLLQSLLVGVRPIDPLAFGAATIALLAVLGIATWIPASRAARLDPMRALRSE